jgi:VWFA-related protein
VFRSASIAVTAALLLALGCASASADDSKLHVDIASVDDSALPSVSAVVNVLDANDRPVSGLDASAIQATIDGKPANVEQLQSVVDSQVALSVVLAVDVSGSMAGQPLASAQQAASDFVHGLSAQDSVSILTFGDSVTTALEPTTDKDAVAAALAQLSAGGNTALYAAASQAIAKVSDSPSTRRVVILLSDGVDYGGKSGVSRDDSLAQAKAMGVPVYTIGLGSEIDRNYLSELATATAARFLETPSPAGLSQLYDDIAGLLRGQYVVKLMSPQTDAGVPHVLELTVSAGGLTAVASKNLPAAAAPAVPQLSLKGLVSGENVNSLTTVTAVATGVTPAEVRFLLDGKPLADTTAPPFTASIDPGLLKSGNHSLHVEARDASGKSTTLDVSFAVGAAGGTSLLRPQLAGSLVVAALCLAGFFWFRRRRPEVQRKVVQVRLRPWSNGGAAGEGPSSVDEPVSLIEPEPVPEEEVLAKLIMVGGPNAGKEFPVGSAPLSVGNAEWCDIVLSDDAGLIGAEEARAWVHGDKLMFHRLTRLTVLAIDGDIGGWLVLEHGDEVTIGPHRLRLEVLAGRASEQAKVNEAVVDAVERMNSHVVEGWLRPVDDFSPMQPADEDFDSPAAASSA